MTGKRTNKVGGRRKWTGDGSVKTFYFGEGANDWEIQATTLESAIRKFRVGCPEPYLYVPSDQRVVETVTEAGYEKTVVIGAKPKAKVPVFVRDERAGRRIKIASIPFDEEASVPLLPGTTSEPVSAVLQVDMTGRGLVRNRRAIDFQLRELNRQAARLEIQRAAMLEQMEKLKAQVELGLKSIWMVELYLGSKQELRVLREGATAPESEPITVMQRVLCMDEEIVIWAWFNKPELLENPEKAFDYKNIEDFDRWLLESDSHVDQIIPAQKGIAALRVRRNPKERQCCDIADAFRIIGEEAADRQTYILVRNGKNLYRIWADTNLWPRLFPRKTELDLDVLRKQQEGNWHSWDESELADAKEGYLRGLIVIQGLLDHTTVFHPLPERIVVFDSACVQRTMRLVRDDEPALVSDTSFMDWHGYKTWLHGQVRVGARVLWTGSIDYSNNSNDLRKRTGLNYVSAPFKDELYVVYRYAPLIYGGGTGPVFLYNPGGTIYPKSVFSCEPPHERKRRIPFRCYNDEVVAFDAISLRYLKHLLLDRSQRQHYMKSLPILYSWWKLAKQEFQNEQPFIELVLTQAGIAHDDPARPAEAARCRRLVRWWKLRTQEARTLGTDEAKALRMIVKAFRAGEDYHADPERGLPPPEFADVITADKPGA